MTRGKKTTTSRSPAPIVGDVGVEAVMPLKRDDQNSPIVSTIPEGSQSEAPEPAGNQPGVPLPTTVTGDVPDVQAAATDSTLNDASDASLANAPDLGSAADMQRLRLATALEELASSRTVRITSPRNFRRADMRHPKGITDYPIENFTDEQLELLEADPELSVEYI